MKYGKFLRDWLLAYKKPYVKPDTYKGFLSSVRLHIPKSIKDCEITQLNVMQIQVEINNIPRSRTRESVYQIYSSSLRFAYDLGYIQRDISRLLKKPKHTRKIGTALSSDELQDFLQKIKGHRVENFFKFCLYSGARRSEILKIRWSDIDCVKGLLHIRGTKTVTSDRYIPLFPQLIEVLRKCKIIENVRIFRHNADYVSKTFKKFCPNHKLHDLRHTFASKCLECGISMKTVQSWLGHSDYQTTANIYTHISQEFYSSEIEKLKF